MATLVSAVNLIGPNLFVATLEGIVYGGNVYREGLRSHPEISLRLSDGYYGTVEVNDVTIDLVTLTKDYLTALGAVEMRGTLGILRLLDVTNLASPVVLRTISGLISSVEYTPEGTYRIVLQDKAKTILDQPTPKLVVSSSLFGSSTFNNLDLNLPVPIILGATRERIPLRYVEEDQTNDRFRYVVGSDLSLSPQTEPLVVPIPNNVYQALGTGPGLIPNRDYDLEISPRLNPPPGPSSTGTVAGSLNGAAGVYGWQLTVLNGLGETTPSATFFNSTAYNGSSIGGEKLKWYPGSSPAATGFRLYRSDDSGSTYQLVVELLDSVNYRKTDDAGLVYIEYTDAGATRDASVTPPATDTTRAGVVSIVFDRMQFGQSSQLAPLLADVECTDISPRTDSLGWWIYRYNDVRDYLRANQPLPVSYKMSGFWDFRNKPTSSAYFDRSGNTWSNGPRVLLTDRTGKGTGSVYIHSRDLLGLPGRPEVYWSDLNYGKGINGSWAAGSGFSSPNVSRSWERFAVMPFYSGATSLTNIATTSGLRIEVMCKPALGTGGRTMRVLCKGFASTAPILLGVSSGRPWARLKSGSTEYNAYGTTAMDGGWHKLALEISREGTLQGAAPVGMPAFYSQASVATIGASPVNSLTLNMPMPSAASNSCISVAVMSRGTASSITPSGVTLNGVLLNGPIGPLTVGASDPYLNVSIWDGVGKVTASGSYPLQVVFNTAPAQANMSAVCLTNINQGSGTTYRDVTASGGSTGGSTPSLTFTPTEAQNVSYMIDCITVAASAGSSNPNNFLNWSASPGSLQTQRAPTNSINLFTKNQLFSAMSTKPEVSGGAAQVMSWKLSKSLPYGQMAVAYKPLASVTASVQKHDYMKLYVDDVEQSSVTIDGLGTLNESTAGTGHVGIGTGGGEEDSWTGWIDSCSITLNQAGTPTPPFWNFGPGRTGHGSNALVCASGDFLPYVDSPDATYYDVGTDDFTIEGWIKITTLPSTLGANSTLFKKGSTATAGYKFFINTSDQVVMRIIRGGVNSDAVGATALKVNRWYYICGVVDRETAGVAGSVKVLLDGVQDANLNLTAAAPANINVTAPLTFGFTFVTPGYIPSEWFVGSIDDFHLFQGLRTATEAFKIYGLGMRNVVAQVRAVLESGTNGPLQTVDDTSFTVAQNAIKDLTWDGQAANVAQQSKYVTDYAMIERLSLRDHLSELLRTRGLILGINTSGLWTITVDTQKASSLNLGFEDGIFENIRNAPAWKTSKISDVVKTLLVKYRPRRNATGGIDSFTLQAAKRNVSTLGKDAEIQLLAIRDRDTADRLSDYLSKRLLYGDSTTSIDTGEDACSLALGDVVTITDGRTNTNGALYEVQAIAARGAEHHLEVSGWSSSFYTYTAKTLPQDIVPELTPSLDTVYPAPPSGVTIQGVQSAIVATALKLTVRWTPPTSNYGGVKIWYRNTAPDQVDVFTTPWVSAIEVDRNTDNTAIVGIKCATSEVYVVAVQTRSPSGLYSIFSAESNAYTCT